MRLGKGANLKTADDSIRPELVEVLYDPVRQEELITRLLRRFCELAQADPRLEAEFATYVALHCIAAFKSDTFAEEKEWRILVTKHPPKDLQRIAEVAPSRFGLSPFIGVSFGKERALTSVGHGPKLDHGLASNATRLALDVHGYGPNIELWHSKVTYR